MHVNLEMSCAVGIGDYILANRQNFDFISQRTIES